MTDRRPARSGANTAARQLAEFLRAHAAREDELLGEYQRLCVELPSPALRYLARLIHSDEERHRRYPPDRHLCPQPRTTLV
jgi:hypothetical protein